MRCDVVCCRLGAHLTTQQCTLGEGLPFLLDAVHVRRQLHRRPPPVCAGQAAVERGDLVAVQPPYHLREATLGEVVDGGIHSAEGGDMIHHAHLGGGADQSEEVRDVVAAEVAEVCAHVVLVNAGSGGGHGERLSDGRRRGSGRREQ